MSKETAPFYVIRQGRGLVPEFQHDAELIDQFPFGERLKVDIRSKRYPRRHRFYWKYLRQVVQATECAPNADALHQAAKMATGHTTPVIVNGIELRVPGSIAFDKMTEEQFETYLEAVIRWIADSFGVTPEEMATTP